MNVLTQSVREGSMSVVVVPAPQLHPGGVLVRTAASVISPGTERAALDFAKASLLQKARRRPDLVMQVARKVRRDGLWDAVEAARTRLDRPVAPGYACAGTVLELAPDVAGLKVGDRVACAGAGYATHAELNVVPKNLVVPIPRRPSGDLVDFEDAAFTTLGAIALHAARLAHPQLGDRAVIIGLGAVGLLAVQILRAHGCRVAGVDINGQRCGLARTLGADLAIHPADAGNAIATWSGALGADLVLVAAATLTSEPAVLAAELSRDKGRIVAVGATGLDLPRRLLYEKELSLVVSRSYGPGRYDPQYEEHGRDYPLPYVRWTERENMKAFLDLVVDGAVDVRSLISHRFPITEAELAYQVLARENVLGILLEYPAAGDRKIHSTRLDLPSRPDSRGRMEGRAGVSIIGTGNFARAVLLPALKKEHGIQLRGAVAMTGLSARSAADTFGFAYCSTAVSDVWNDPDTRAVVIATRHDVHAQLVIEALEQHKAVFVEKPLCLSQNQLDAVCETYARLQNKGHRPLLMVGFNRRFAPTVQFLKAKLGKGQAPINVAYRINAGRLPRNSWIANADEGGGRVLGEVCHFVDLCAFLSGAPIEQVSAMRSCQDADDVVVNLRTANGSVATLAYVVDGDPTTSKERIELFGGGMTAVIDDFRRASVSFSGRKKTIGGRFARRDKGHRAEIEAFVRATQNSSQSPVPFEDAVNATRATFAILQAIERNTLVDV